MKEDIILGLIGFIAIIGTMSLTLLFDKLFNKIPNIKKGDRIKCIGNGYPHWKVLEFNCTEIFKDGSIGIENSLKVDKKDFYKISH
jgi:hypothetical protein